MRRHNAVALYRAWAQIRLGAGDASKGLDQAFAQAIAVSPSMWSQIKSSRPISDKLARQIEHHLQQPVGWLDEHHASSENADEAEHHFLEVARQAWRAANARGRRELLRALRAAAGGP